MRTFRYENLQSISTNLLQVLSFLLLRKDYPTAHDHHFLHLHGIHLSHPIRHETSITDAVDCKPVHVQSLQALEHTFGLKDLGPVGSGRVGVPEENQIGYVEVKGLGERTHLAHELPPRIATIAVDHNESTPVGTTVIGGTPKVNGCLVVYVDGDWRQTAESEVES